VAAGRVFGSGRIVLVSMKIRYLQARGSSGSQGNWWTILVMAAMMILSFCAVALTLRTFYRRNAMISSLSALPSSAKLWIPFLRPTSWHDLAARFESGISPSGRCAMQTRTRPA